MDYKVAVASSDGKVINQHFGRAQEFLIFQIRGNGFEFVEKRQNAPACGGGEHNDDVLEKSVELISDCRIVLACQIGPTAQAVLASRGVQSYAVPLLIEDAVNKLITSSFLKNE